MSRIGSVPVGCWIKWGDHEYKITGKSRAIVFAMDWDGKQWQFTPSTKVWVYEA